MNKDLLEKSESAEIDVTKPVAIETMNNLPVTTAKLSENADITTYSSVDALRSAVLRDGAMVFAKIADSVVIPMKIGDSSVTSDPYCSADKITPSGESCLSVCTKIGKINNMVASGESISSIHRELDKMGEPTSSMLREILPEEYDTIDDSGIIKYVGDTMKWAADEVMHWVYE